MKQNHVNKGVLLTIAMISSFFNPFMGASVNIALPVISKEFSLSAVSLSWIAMSFLLASAIFLVPFGKIADMKGRKKIFLMGNVILTIGSLLCAISFNGNTLIAFRFIQGIGSAMVFCSSMAMVISAFPQQSRGKAIGFVVFSVYTGLTIAPFLGGLLTEIYGWRSLFYINTFAGIIVIACTYIWIKKDWIEKMPGNFDFYGSILYMCSMLLIMYGFSKLPEMKAIISLFVGIGLFSSFIFVERKHLNPVLEINLFLKNRIFAFSNLAALINYAATFAITFIMSLYLQYVKGLNPSEAGIVLITQPAVMAFVAIFSGRMSDKYDPRILASTGMGMLVIGLFLLVFLAPQTQIHYLIVCLIIIGFGFGMFSSPNTNSVMGSVDKKYLGVASATVSTMRLTGQMVSMATAAMVINIYIGNEKININNIQNFMQSTKVLFIIFAFLCFLGVFASLARGKNT